MSERHSYSEEFRDAVRVKILNRGSRPLREICAEVGISAKMAANWARPRASDAVMKNQKSSVHWKPEQKLQALIAAAS